MSSALITPDSMRMIERLLAEVGGRLDERDADREESRTRVLHDAVEGGVTQETDLRRLLAEHVKAAEFTDAHISLPGKLDSRPFAATRSGPATWSTLEIREHSSYSADRKRVEHSGAVPSRSPSVVAAIHAFLGACQKETRPPKTAGVAGSLRRAFPDLDISDADLADAIIREVSRAFISNADAEGFSATGFEMHALETWENEGGAIP